MKLFVGVADHDWYTFLRDSAPDEVNFWWPSGGTGFQALQPGEPFLFKAKYPYRAIVGGGYFVRYLSAPASMAWQAFGVMNGVPSFEALLERVRHYNHGGSPDPVIGCTILAEPFFFPEALWLDEPADWAKNIVRGKRYDTDDLVAAHLWDQVVARTADPRTRIGPQPSARDGMAAGSSPAARFGAATLTRHRLGQGAFRLSVLDAYDNRCAVTGERVVPVLEAAHIRPYAKHGPHQVPNGLALRADIHRLFDLGYVTVDPTLRFRVSSLLDKEYANGKDYYRFHGEKLAVTPRRLADRPAGEYLEWHGDEVFRP